MAGMVMGIKREIVEKGKGKETGREGMIVGKGESRRAELEGSRSICKWRRRFEE